MTKTNRRRQPPIILRRSQRNNVAGFRRNMPLIVAIARRRLTVDLL